MFVCESWFAFQISHESCRVPPPLHTPPPTPTPFSFLFVHDLITSWWLKLFCSVNRLRRRLTCWTKMRWSLDCYRYQHWLQLQSSPHAPGNLFVLQVSSFFKHPEGRSGISDVQYSLESQGCRLIPLPYLFLFLFSMQFFLCLIMFLLMVIRLPFFSWKFSDIFH